MRCPVCGAPLADDAVICQKCGKVVRRQTPPGRSAPQRPAGMPRQGGINRNTPPQRRPAAYGGQPQPQRQRTAAPRNVNTDQNMNVQQAQPRPRRTVPRPVYDAPPPEIQASEARGKFRRNNGVKGKLRLAARIAAVCIMVAVIYICGAFIQTFRVRLATYHFKSSMKMTYSSYGKAIDNYFEDGHWSANLFTNKCTYTGTSKHGEKYEMVFSTGVNIRLTAITIDGEPVEKDMIESKAMALFI